jgi:hypothetical protein
MISDWQGKNWDPAVDGGSSQYFDDFCAALLAPANGTSHVKIGGVAISQALLNYGSYVEEVRMPALCIRKGAHRMQYISEVCPPPNNVDDVRALFQSAIADVHFSAVLQHVRRRQLQSRYGSRSDLAPVELPGLHPVGLLLGTSLRRALP